MQVLSSRPKVNVYWLGGEELISRKKAKDRLKAPFDSHQLMANYLKSVVERNVKRREPISGGSESDSWQSSGRQLICRRISWRILFNQQGIERARGYGVVVGPGRRVEAAGADRAARRGE